MYSLDMDKAANEANLQIPVISDHKANSKLVTSIHKLGSYTDEVEYNTFCMTNQATQF